MKRYFWGDIYGLDWPDKYFEIEEPSKGSIPHYIQQYDIDESFYLRCRSDDLQKARQILKDIKLKELVANNVNNILEIK